MVANASISLSATAVPIPETATISIVVAVKSVVAKPSPSVTLPAEIISILSGELTAPIIIFPLVVVVKTISFPAPVAVADVDTVKSPLVVVILIFPTELTVPTVTPLPILLAMVKSPEVAADPVMVNSELPVWVKTISPEVEALDWVTTVADPDLETTKTPPVTVSKFSKLGATASISLLTPVAPIPEMATISIMACC